MLFFNNNIFSFSKKSRFANSNVQLWPLQILASVIFIHCCSIKMTKKQIYTLHKDNINHPGLKKWSTDKADKCQKQFSSQDTAYTVTTGNINRITTVYI